MWAVIGGTTLEKLFNANIKELVKVDTPFGYHSSGMAKIHCQDYELIFLPRHGKNHELLPSEINYRANIFALKKLKVTKILALSAVGSLKEHLKPGDVVIPNQYINQTNLNRHHTFCGDGIVGHVSLANPVTTELVDEVAKLRKYFNYNIHFNCTAISIEGPYYSTRAESHQWQKMGADIIGMTGFPEYALAREAGICYLPCSFITDYDCWDPAKEPVTMERVIKNQLENQRKALQFIDFIMKHLMHILPRGCPSLGLRNNLLTNFDDLSKEKKEWFSVIIS